MLKHLASYISDYLNNGGYGRVGVGRARHTDTQARIITETKLLQSQIKLTKLTKLTKLQVVRQS